MNFVVRRDSVGAVVVFEARLLRLWRGTYSGVLWAPGASIQFTLWGVEFVFLALGSGIPLFLNLICYTITPYCCSWLLAIFLFYSSPFLFICNIFILCHWFAFYSCILLSAILSRSACQTLGVCSSLRYGLCFCNRCSINSCSKPMSKFLEQLFTAEMRPALRDIVRVLTCVLFTEFHVRSVSVAEKKCQGNK
jgi:hypothetical protein